MRRTSRLVGVKESIDFNSRDKRVPVPGGPGQLEALATELPPEDARCGAAAGYARSLGLRRADIFVRRSAVRCGL